MVDYIIKRVFHVCNNNVWNTMYMEIGCCISRILLKSFGCDPMLFRMRRLAPVSFTHSLLPCLRVDGIGNVIKRGFMKQALDS